MITYRQLIDAFFSERRTENDSDDLWDRERRRLERLCEIFHCNLEELRAVDAVEEAVEYHTEPAEGGPIAAWKREMDSRCRARFQDVLLHRYPGIEDRIYPEDLVS